MLISVVNTPKQDRLTAKLILMQPFDAAAAAMDGGLLGASETSYASRATLCVAVAVWCVLQVLPRSLPGLAGIWLSLKGLSVGRTLAATYRLTSSKSPLSKQPHSATLSQESGKHHISDARPDMCKSCHMGKGPGTFQTFRRRYDGGTHSGAVMS